MTAALLDGKKVAALLHEDIRKSTLVFEEKKSRKPGLAVILVGTDAASTIYVANKRKACLEAGFQSFSYDLPETTSEAQLTTLINDLNKNHQIDGILVQLPLPAHINSKVIIEQIDPRKDVDGFHPYNIGRLAQGHPALRPCTPQGIMLMLEHYKICPRGKNAVVVGASNIVGKPMAMELLLAKATVTICHTETKNLKEHVKTADILVVATGTHGVIDTHWLNGKQIIIDVGIHRAPNGKLRGDIDFIQAKEKAAWITPVPGGVGPMTIATLLKNTLQAGKGTEF